MPDERTSCDGCAIESCSAKTKREAESDKDFEERQALARRLCRIRHKILVLSGKGGVGKSTIAASLAVAFAAEGNRVGVLDIDLHGPSVPRLLGVEDAHATGTAEAIEPIETPRGIRVMSMGFLLPNRDDALIWRGPLKYSMIRQFLTSVDWGELDYLIVDSPPGTGDEPLSAAQLIEDADGAVIVTTPQALAVNDVRRAVNFAGQVGLPILGVIENMSGYVCPDCGAETDVFGRGGGEEMAGDMGVPFLGRVPIDASLVRAADAGRLEEYLIGDSPGAAAFATIIKTLSDTLERLGGRKDD
jgi:ATP-binding protein involved in chromosome partitioning